MHGDRVLIKVVSRKKPVRRGARRPAAGDDNDRLEGTVVRVLERKSPSIVGRFFEHPRFPYVQPLEARMIHDIRIPPNATNGARHGQIVVVVLTAPPGKYQDPEGEVAEVLGYSGDPGIEYKIVEHKFRLPTRFSPEAELEAERVPGSRPGRRNRRPRGFQERSGGHHRRRDRPGLRRRHNAAAPAERPLPAGRPHRGRVALRARRRAARPRRVRARHLGLLPGPRHPDAPAETLQRHLQPEPGRGPPGLLRDHGIGYRGETSSTAGLSKGCCAAPPG